MNEHEERLKETARLIREDYSGRQIWFDEDDLDEFPFTDERPKYLQDGSGWTHYEELGYIQGPVLFQHTEATWKLLHGDPTANRKLDNEALYGQPTAKLNRAGRRAQKRAQR